LIKPSKFRETHGLKLALFTHVYTRETVENKNKSIKLPVRASQVRMREYKLKNGQIIRMTEEEFQRLVEYFIELQKTELLTPLEQSQKTSPLETQTS
jgi:hypothetical protein